MDYKAAAEKLKSYNRKFDHEIMSRTFEGRMLIAFNKIFQETMWQGTCTTWQNVRMSSPSHRAKHGIYGQISKN